MFIEHIAMYVTDLEKAREFYSEYFDAVPSELYYNRTTGFSSYFMSFEGGARLELMTRVGISDMKPFKEQLGYAHIGINVGSKERVEELTERLRNDKYTVVKGPRKTGDGYYESVILDMDGNRVEIMCDFVI